MATLTRQQQVETGVTLSFAAAGGSGDVVDNSDGKTIVLVKNDSGSSITVTVAKQGSTTINDPTYGELTKADATHAIANGAIGSIGPFKKSAFNNSSNQISISYSATTSVTVAAVYN